MDEQSSVAYDHLRRDFKERAAREATAELLAQVEQLTAQRDALAAAVNKLIATHEAKGYNPVTSVSYIIDCNCPSCTQARAALALVADTAGKES